MAASWAGLAWATVSEVAAQTVSTDHYLLFSGLEFANAGGSCNVGALKPDSPFDYQASAAGKRNGNPLIRQETRSASIPQKTTSPC